MRATYEYKMNTIHAAADELYVNTANFVYQELSSRRFSAKNGWQRDK